MLHNNESSLIFNDEKDLSKVFQFDLETGKVVQQFKTGKEKIEFNKLSNEAKNG